ncbi:hypothetical protein FRC00_003503 [Tulasnella sp. 408]|nr:hypothetical protein FRC00_003503 [Tulasnella sp. 408]
MVTTRGKRVNYAALEEPDDDFDMAVSDRRDEEPAERRPASKKRKTKHAEGDEEFSGLASPPKPVKGKAKRRSSGKARLTILDGFMNIPLDIFAEICIELTPLDLLQLARSTRRLREILMSKESKPIWRRARANITDLPDCPEDLSEPQYASLMFEVGCQICNKGTRKTDHQLRVRLCNSCLDTRLMTYKHMYAIWYDMPWEILEGIPHAWFGNKKLYRIDIFNQARSELVGEDGKTKKELKDSVSQRLQKLSRMMYDTGNAMIMWLEARAHSKQLENMLLSEDRESKVIQKLVAQGWDADDIPTLMPEWDSLVYKPVPLTEQTWRRMYPKLVPLLELCREERLRRERRERQMDRMEDFYDFYSNYIGSRMAEDPSLSRGHFLLAANLLSRVPELKKELNEEDVPHYAQEKWEAHRDAVARANEEYKARVLALLVGVVQKGTRADSVVKKEERSMEPEEPQAGPSTSTPTPTPSDLTNLGKITTVFKCTVCYERLWYPAVLQHTCCRGKIDRAVGQYFQELDEDMLEEELEDAYFLFTMTAFGYTYEYRKRRNRSDEPYNVDNLVMDRRWPQMVRMALRDLGLSENATVREVEAEGMQFTSLMCNGGAERNEGLSFMEVIEHNCSRHDTPLDETQPVIKRDQPGDEADASSPAPH